VTKAVELYVDGACRGNPGPGGWGVLLRYRGIEKELAGGQLSTTNNQMELMAAIQGIKALKKPCAVALYTDSQYVKKGITHWIGNWRKNSWKNAAGAPIKNKALWQELESVCKGYEIQWHWVRGHNGHPENERVDALARAAIDRVLADNQENGVL